MFRHLASELVAYDTGKVYVAERLAAAVLVAGHYHARNPEEYDVGTRYQIVGGVVVVDLFVVGAAYAVKYRDRPQPRREPRVEHILVLTQIGRRERRIAGFGARLFDGFGERLCHDVSALRQVVGRYALSPPQLARYAPVLDVLHPVAVGILVFRRDELYRILHYGLGRRLGQLLHRQEPLHRQLGLDRCARALREADVVGVGLDLIEQTGSLQVALDYAAALESVHAHVHAYLVVDRAVVVEYVYCLQCVFLSEHVVVDVVRRRHFQRTRTELLVDILVADDRYAAPYQRHYDSGVVRQPAVAFVGGVDAERRIAQNRLGTRGSHDDAAVAAFDLIAQIVELALRLLVNHLLVRECGLSSGVPVDHAHAAIDPTLVEQVAEDLYDALAACVVHREACALPVARGAQLAQLFEDYASVLLLPLPCVGEELLARERRLVYALGFELGDDLGFGGYRGVVGARHPAGVLSLHARATHQNILQRVVEHVSHVKHARDVGRRNDYRVRFALVGLRVK